MATERAQPGVIGSRTPLMASPDLQRTYNGEAVPRASSAACNDSQETDNIQEDVSSGPWSRVKKYLRLIGFFILKQWFLVGLMLVIVIASQVQVPRSEQETKEVVVTYLAVAVVFFVTGCTLSTRALIENYARWKIHLFVQVQCFLMTSATTFAIVSACATNPNFMDPWLLIGLLVVGCSPTTISSNVVLTREAHGNETLTVVESTIGNFLGPFLTPLLLSMYTSTNAWYVGVLPDETGGYGEIYKRVFQKLGLSIFLPLVVGQIVQYLLPNLTRKVFLEWKLNKIGSVSLLFLIWQTFDQAFETGAFSSVKPDNMIFIVFISLGMWILWVAVSVLTSAPWLPRADTVAMAYTVPGKGPAFAVPLTSVLYIGLSRMQQSKLQIPIVIFQNFQIALGSMLTAAFRRWVAKNKVHDSPEGSEEDE